MNKYVLLQAPIAENDYSGQIVILNNANAIDRKKINRLINEGYNHVGFIESECRPNELKSGFEHDLRDSLERAHNLFDKISALAGNHLETIY